MIIVSETSETFNPLSGFVAGAEASPRERTSGRGPQAESKYYLPQVWAGFLEQFPWDWFITIVPNDIIHPESLEKLWGVTIHRLNRYIYGQTYWKDKRKGVLWAAGYERQKRGAPHIHALIGGVPDYVNRYQFYQWLKDRSCDFSKIEVYKPAHGAEYYLSKSTYAWKQGEIDVSDSLQAFREGVWISAKDLHAEYCRDYGDRLRPPVSAYSW